MSSEGLEVEADFHDLEAYTGNRESKVMLLQGQLTISVTLTFRYVQTVLCLELNIRLDYFLLYIFLMKYMQ